MKPLQQQPPLRPAARKIQSFTTPGQGPHHNPVEHPRVRSSNALAAEAVRKAGDHGGKIDPRQMRNDPSNLD